MPIRERAALPLLALEKRSGTESIHFAGKRLGKSVLDFWQWAWSDLVDNTHRGVFAEYLVALALGVDGSVRRDGAAWDLTAQDGTRVEVKASGVIQSWGQRKPSTPRFSVRAAEGWDPASGTWDQNEARHADVYVFCLHHHREKESADPTDVSQWTFWVLAAETLNRELGGQKSISVPGLEKLGASKVPYAELRAAVEAARHT